MYLNKANKNNAIRPAGLTLTLDVFKWIKVKLQLLSYLRLTLTLDVFKF